MTAAYVVVPGVTADEAEARGLVVVEEAINGAARIFAFGYYVKDDAPGVAPKKKANADVPAAAGA